MGQILVESPAKPGGDTTFCGQFTPKPAIHRQIAHALFALYSLSRFSHFDVANIEKCKLLLYLGNFVAFFIDNERSLSYDFFTGTQFVDNSSYGLSPLPVSICG